MTGERLRLMAVHAHPDDESSKGAATTARYAAEGVEVLVVTCTGGERGDVLNPQLPARSSGGLDGMRESAGTRWLRRRAGARRAPAPVAGLRRLRACPRATRCRRCRRGASRSSRSRRRRPRWSSWCASSGPHVITTYDPTGGYPHPDHIMCHRVSVEAFHAAGDPERYRGLGEPWKPLKLYYNHGFSLARMRAVHEAIARAPAGSRRSATGSTRAQAREIPEREVTTRIECSAYFPQRDAALRAHATQIDPDGFFFAVPRDARGRRVADRGVRARESRACPIDRCPEDDLFAGLRGGGPPHDRPLLPALAARPPSPSPSDVTIRRHAGCGLAGVPRLRRSRSRSRSPCVLPVPVADQAAAQRRPPRARRWGSTTTTAAACATTARPRRHRRPGAGRRRSRAVRTSTARRRTCAVAPGGTSLRPDDERPEATRRASR